MKNRVKIHLNGNKTIYKYQKWSPELTPWYSWKKYTIKSASGLFNWEKWPAINDYTEYTYKKYPVSKLNTQFQCIYQKKYNALTNNKWTSNEKEKEYIEYGYDLTTATKVSEHDVEDRVSRLDRCSGTYVYCDGNVPTKVDKVKIDGWMAAMSQLELDNFLCYTYNNMNRVGIKTTRGYERKAYKSYTTSTNLNTNSIDADKTSGIVYWNKTTDAACEPTIDCGYIWNYVAYNSYLGKYDVEPTMLVSTKEPSSDVYVVGHYEHSELYFSRYSRYPDRDSGYGLSAQGQDYLSIPDPEYPETNYSVHVNRAWVDWKGGGVGNPSSYDDSFGVDPYCNTTETLHDYTTNQQPVPHNPCSIIEGEAQISSENEKVQTFIDGINRTGRMYTGVSVGGTEAGEYMWGNANDPYNERYCNFLKQYEEGRYWIVMGDFELEDGYVENTVSGRYKLYKNDVKVYVFTPESYTDGEYLYNVYQLTVSVKNMGTSSSYTSGYTLPYFIRYTSASAVKSRNDTYNKFNTTKVRNINANCEYTTEREYRTNGFGDGETVFWELTGEPQPHWIKDDSVPSVIVGSDNMNAYPQDGQQDGNWYTSVPVEIKPNEYVELVWDNENANAYPEEGQQDGYWYSAQGYEYEQHPDKLIGTAWSFSQDDYPNEDFKLGYWYKYIGQESVDEITLEDDSITTGISYEVNINPDKNLQYGKVAIASLTFSIPDKIAMGIYKNVRGQLIEAEIKSSRYSEWEKLGKFYLYSQKRNNNTVQYTCYDKLYDAVEYEFNPDDWPSINNMDYVEFIETLGDFIGIPVKTETFTTIPEVSGWKVFLPSDKCAYREILEELGTVNLCSFYLNENGELCMWREGSNSAILNKSHYRSLELGTEFQRFIKVENGDTNYIGSVSLDYTVPMVYKFEKDKVRPAESDTAAIGKYLHSIEYIPAKIETDFDFLLKAGDVIYIAHPYETIVGDGMTSLAKIIIFNKKIARGIVTFECTGVSNYFN